MVVSGPLPRQQDPDLKASVAVRDAGRSQQSAESSHQEAQTHPARPPDLHLYRYIVVDTNALRAKGIHDATGKFSSPRPLVRIDGPRLQALDLHDAGECFLRLNLAVCCLGLLQCESEAILLMHPERV